MDSFESLARLLLEKESYWTRQSEKVDLSKEEKARTGKHSIPRPEIDIVAYRPSENKIIALEVKSFLVSPGVRAAAFREEFDITQGIYKLFTSPNYRDIVFERLLNYYRKIGLADDQTVVQLGLAAGKIYSTYENELIQIFKKRWWLLWTPNEMATKGRALSKVGYENDPFVLVSKLLVGNP